jgi:hypothetical protein
MPTTRFVPILRFLALGLTLTVLATAAQAQGSQARTAPDRQAINLIAILDVSTSMRGTFSQMQDYVYGSIVGKLLRSGDYFCLYTFGVRTRRVFAGQVDLPRDDGKLKELIYAMAPDEEGTDIGLMLGTLDELLKAGGFPNARTSIVWATDGRNDPPAGSRYAGKDIFNPKAFDSYSILKSSSYKVLLLSIGSDTAAKDLSGPMGGEYLEVGRDVTASKLEAVIGDFTSSIDLASPARSQNLSGSNPRIRLDLSSSYSEAKDLAVERILVGIDGAAPEAAASPRLSLRIPPKSRIGIEVPLPAGIAPGDHYASVELRGAADERIGSPQRISFSVGSRTNPVELAAAAFLLAVSASILLVGLLRRG